MMLCFGPPEYPYRECKVAERIYYNFGCYATTTSMPVSACCADFVPEFCVYRYLVKYCRCKTLGYFSSPFLRHVFKRLRFLGNKNLSHVTTLFFLAVWHGLHSGYALCFSMEFLIIIVERQVGCGEIWSFCISAVSAQTFSIFQHEFIVNRGFSR